MTQTELEKERQRRIQVTLWAYAYEIKHHSIVNDFKFDEISNQINTEIETGHKILDEFFKTEWRPYTGMWIYKHPELDKVKLLYKRIYKNK